METFVDADIIDLIKKNEMDKAFKLINKRHPYEFLPFIKSLSWNLDEDDVNTIYNDYFLNFCRNALEGKFNYQNDKAFLSITEMAVKCKHTPSSEKRKPYLHTFILIPEIIDQFRDELSDEEKNAAHDFLKKKMICMELN